MKNYTRDSTTTTKTTTKSNIRDNRLGIYSGSGRSTSKY